MIKIRRGEPLALSFELKGADGAPMRFPKDNMFLVITISDTTYEQQDTYKETHWCRLTGTSYFPVLEDIPVKEWVENASEGFLYVKDGEYVYSIDGVSTPYTTEFDMSIPTKHWIDKNYNMTISLAWGKMTADQKRLDMRKMQYTDIAPIKKIIVGADIRGGHNAHNTHAH